MRWGVKATTPQIVSVSAAVFRDQAEGLFLQVEPGLSGIKLSVGHAWYADEDADNHPFTVLPMGPEFRKLSLMHTWGDPWGIEPGRTCLGVEWGTVVGFFLGFGIFHQFRVRGDEGGGLVSASCGVGF